MIRWLARRLIAEAYRKGYRDGWQVGSYPITRDRAEKQYRASVLALGTFPLSTDDPLPTQTQLDQARREGRL